MILKPKDKNEIRDLMEDRRNRRMASQPLDYPSCGSVFRNPEGYNAWQLIDGIGYRGRQIGDAKVSEKHCNFILNMGSASAEDYLKLVREIQEKVYEKYGVRLHTEMEMFNWKQTA
jgi:UDP-N-acetylmuramate dehydrogenase